MWIVQIVKWTVISVFMFLFILLIGGAFTGCSSVTYKSGDTTVSRWSFGTMTEIGLVDIKNRDGTGARVEAAKTDQVEALKAVAEGVAKGLAAGAKP